MVSPVIHADSGPSRKRTSRGHVGGLAQPAHRHLVEVVADDRLVVP